MPSFIWEKERIPSIDLLLTHLGCSHPCVLVHLLISLGFFIFGLGALETSTLLPVPLYGCWNAVTAGQLSGKLACSNVELLTTNVHTSKEDPLWSCSNYAWWQPQLWGGTLLVAGRFVICIAAGIGVDVFGRRRSTIVWMGTFFVFAFAKSFAPLVEVYVVCVTMEAICSQATAISLLLIACEGSIQKECVRSGCLVLLGHSVGVGVGIPLTAAFIGPEIFRQVARSVPAILFLLYICFLPESVRWLISQGRLEDIAPTLRKTYHASLTDGAKIQASSVYQETLRSLKNCRCKGSAFRQAVLPLTFSRSFARLLYPFVGIGFLIGASIGFRLIHDPLPYHSTEDRAVASGVAELVALQVLGLILARLPVRRVLVLLSALLAVAILLTRVLKQAYYESCIGEVFFSNAGHFVAILTWVWLIFGVIRLTPTHSRGTLLGVTIGFATLGHSLSNIIYKIAKSNLEMNDFMVAVLFGGFCMLSGCLALALHSTPEVIPDSVIHLGGNSKFRRENMTQEDQPLKNETEEVENTRL